VAALAPFAHASVQITGVLSTGSHGVIVDTAFITDEGGGAYTFPTPGWQGDSLAVDTFAFPPIDYSPMQVDLALTVDGNHILLSIPGPMHDTWYIISSMPTEAKVKFLWLNGIEEDGRRPSEPERLTVRPGIFTGTATVRAGHVGVGRCEAEIYDALGNRVRTLVLHRSGAAASATWNGDDDLGRRLPEGIYYCCLNDAAGPAVRKLILTR
jgi:hypothetical protein